MKISVKIFGFYHRKQWRRGRGKTKSEKLKRIRRKKGYKKNPSPQTSMYQRITLPVKDFMIL